MAQVILLDIHHIHSIALKGACVFCICVQIFFAINNFSSRSNYAWNRWMFECLNIVVFWFVHQDIADIMQNSVSQTEEKNSQLLLDISWK